MSDCYSCTNCPIDLDASCVKYHLYNLKKTKLKKLGISNKATLELILETIDDKIGLSGISIAGYSLPCLRQRYVINNMKQFTEGVDTDICDMFDRIPPIEDIIYGGNRENDIALEGCKWWRTDLLELRGYFNSVVQIIQTTPA